MRSFKPYGTILLPLTSHLLPLTSYHSPLPSKDQGERVRVAMGREGAEEAEAFLGRQTKMS